MGASASYIYKHCRRLAIRYNAENRAHKFLQKGILPKAPRHPLPENISARDIALSKEQLRELHEKNQQLSEYLKKVYLTSTSKVIGTPSKRPKPKKENEHLKVAMFYEPKVTAPGYCTLSKVIEILAKFQEDPEKWSASGIAHKYNLNKKDVAQLLMYYSLFTVEKFEFMHDKPKKPEEETEKIEFEVYKQLEKKPLRQIEGKVTRNQY